MTLVKRGDVYHYKFLYKGRWYRGSTGQRSRADAELAEAEVKKRTRQDVWGIAPVDRMRTPSFSAWAEVFYKDQESRLRRPDVVASSLRTVLKYWGARPRTKSAKPAVERPERGSSPYRNLRLLDPITDPQLIVGFDRWMAARGISGARMNQLRSCLSMMYRLAMQPAWRSKTRIKENPFAGIRRERVRSRTRVLTIDEIRAILAAAPFHLRVAIAVAVLAPKLRLSNVLALRFDQHIDRGLTRIIVTDHKAQDHAAPLVIPIERDLRAALEAARAANRVPRSSKHPAYVVEYQGRKVKSVKVSLRASVEAAGLVYGVGDSDGVTFHTLRHSMATLLATLPGLSERMRAEVMGQTIATAQKYTHLAGAQQTGAHRDLAAAAPVIDLVAVGTVLGTPGDPIELNPAAIRRIPKRMHRPKTKSKSRRIK